jgi:hypothetical protein
VTEVDPGAARLVLAESADTDLLLKASEVLTGG